MDTVNRSDMLQTYADLYMIDERLLNFKKELDDVYDKICRLPPSVHLKPIWGYTVDINRPLADEEIIPRLRDIQKQVGGSYAIDRVIELIGEVQNLSPQPEIIKCSECKHRYVDGNNVKYNVCKLNHNKAQSDDWFCADAERGTNDE